MICVWQNIFCQALGWIDFSLKVKAKAKAKIKNAIEHLRIFMKSIKNQLEFALIYHSCSIHVTEFQFILEMPFERGDHVVSLAHDASKCHENDNNNSHQFADRKTTRFVHSARTSTHRLHFVVER